MADVEKIVRGLECCKRGFCFACSYNDSKTESIDCKHALVDDALELLKAQEPVEPKKVNRYFDFDDEGHPYNPETYDCGACGKELPWKGNYCPECGRAVKWE